MATENGGFGGPLVLGTGNGQYVYVIACFSVVFGINSTSNADRKVQNSTRRSRVLFAFLSALRVLLIPNTTEKHAMTN